MKNEISLGKCKVGKEQPPLVVAEISANHHGSLERALELIDKAKQAGVQAIKFQTYTPDTITLDIKGGEFLITEESSPWKGKNLYDLYQQAYTPWEWHDALFNRCLEWGLLGFSTPFDETAVDFLEKFDVPCYKVGSPEIIDIPLIKKIASTKKPMFISTGGATKEEISEAVAAAQQAGCEEIVLMKCTMAYPSPPNDMNLRSIPDMEKVFGTLVGLSDHSLGTHVAVAATAMGACMIEKHLTFSREEGGVDASFSLEPEEFKRLVDETSMAWQALGRVQYGPLPSEQSSYSHRPSLYFIVDLPKGTMIESQHIRSVRPNKGLSPKEFEHVVGKCLKVAVKKGTPVSWEALVT